MLTNYWMSRSNLKFAYLANLNFILALRLTILLRLGQRTLFMALVQALAFILTLTQIA